MKARFAVAALSFLFGFLAVNHTAAATLVVTKTEDTDDRSCDADCSLREAIKFAAPGDTVTFSPLFDSPQTIGLGLGQIEINKPITITGPGSSILSISGNNSNRIFQIQSGGDIFITGLTLRNGASHASNFAFGGAIVIAESSLTLNDVVLRNNRTSVSPPGNEPGWGYGGAIYSGSNTTLTLINSKIMDNFMPQWPRHGSGGGIYAAGSTDIYIVDSVLSGNSEGAILGARIVSVTRSTIASNDGETSPASGVGIVGSNVTVTDSLISQNDGVGVAGGATLTIDRCIIANNEGGGISNGGLGTITNTQIHDNSNGGLPGDRGGGVNNSGTLYITNTSITNNTAWDGDGIYNSRELYLTNSSVLDNGSRQIYNHDTSAAKIFVTNSTIAGPGTGVYNVGVGSMIFRNSIVDHVTAPVVISHGYNLIGGTGGSTGWIPSDLTNIAPQLAPRGTNGSSTFTRGPLPGSPAINAGDNSLAVHPQTKLPLTTDQRGYERIVNGTVDIGAYESNYSEGPLWFNGRVLSLGGRGIPNTRVTLSDGTTTLYSQTNPFGYFRFPKLTPGASYTIAIMHKKYMFDSPQLITVDNTLLHFLPR